VLLNAGSAASPSKGDTVGAETTTAAVHQPDLSIGVAGEPGFRGDDVYNNTGQGQDQSQTVATDETAEFPVKLQNDGDAPTKFVVTAGVAGGEARPLCKRAAGRWRCTAARTSPPRSMGQGWTSGLVNARRLD